MIRSLLTLLAIPAALSPALQAQSEVQSCRVYLMLDGTEFREMWLESADAQNLHGKDAETQGQAISVERGKVRSYYFFPPRTFENAENLFREGRFSDAATAFEQLANHFIGMAELPGNPASLAAFYQRECLRLAGDWPKFEKTLERSLTSGLIRGDQRRQSEIDALWLLRLKEKWQELDQSTASWDGRSLPLNQRAQIAFLRAVAREHQAQPDEARSLYQLALGLEAGSGSWIARESGAAILRLFQADPTIKEARKPASTPPSDLPHPGKARLAEAVNFASRYPVLVGGGSSVPTEFQNWLKSSP